MKKTAPADSQSSASSPPVGLMAHLPMSDKPLQLQSFGLLLCLGLLCFTTFQVVITVQDYLKLPTVLTVSNDREAQFPDLVFCSNVPLSYTSADYNQTAFAAKMGKAQASFQSASAQAGPDSRITGSTGSTVNLNNFSSINDPGSTPEKIITPLLHTLGRPVLKKFFGIWSETLLFSCQLPDGSDCSSGAHFEHVDSEQYLNCYRFVPDSPVTSATFVLFSESLIGSSDLNSRFDHGFPMSAVSPSGELEYDRSSGVALYVKHREHYLHEVYKVMVSSGQSSLLTYTEHFDKAISKTTHPCSSDQTIRYLLLKRVDNAAISRSAMAEYVPEWQNFNATRSDCMLRARMDFLQKRCNCRDPIFPIDKQRYRLPVCMNASSPQYLNTSVCFVSIKYVNVSTEHCQEPCSKRYYEVKVSGTKWPLETNIQAMVNALLPQRLDKVQKTFGVNITGLKYIMSLNELIGSPSTGINTTQLALLYKLSGVIGSNFVKLQVRPASDKVQASEENYKVSLLSLVGSIGGLVGLYLGWSAASFIDLLQSGHLLLRFARLRLAAMASVGRERQDKQQTAVTAAATEEQMTEEMDLRECW